MILIASSLFKPEPVVSALISFDIAEYLSKESDTGVVVVSPRASRPSGAKYNYQELINSSFEQVIVNSYVSPESSLFGRLKESYSFGKKLKAYIEMNNKSIEVVYANVWPIFSQFMLARTCRKYKIPYLLHVQDIYPESLTNRLGPLKNIFTKLFLPLDRYILSNAKCVITISEQMKSYLIKTRNLDNSKVKLVRNWQNDSIFNYDSNSHKFNEIFTFMFVGSINKTANVDNIVRAFGELNPSNAKLVIAGDGPDKGKVISLANNYNANIEFLSVLPSDVPKLQSEADILVLALKKGVGSTALPSKLTAYMLSSKPIVVSVDMTSEVANIIRDSNCGWVVEAENNECLQNLFIDILKLDKENIKSIGENSYSFALENLTKDRNLKKIVDLLQNLRRKL